jgi:hypothetical protein
VGAQPLPTTKTAPREQNQRADGHVPVTSPSKQPQAQKQPFAHHGRWSICYHYYGVQLFSCHRFRYAQNQNRLRPNLFFFSASSVRPNRAATDFCLYFRPPVLGIIGAAVFPGENFDKAVRLRAGVWVHVFGSFPVTKGAKSF